MKTRFPLIARMGLAVLALGVAMPSARASDALEQLRKTTEEEVGVVDTQALFKKAELTQKYIAALDNLEKTLAASGQLDAIVNLRAERDEVRKTGATTSHDDKPIADLRVKYLKSLEGIDTATKDARTKAVESLAKRIREQETALTKAGKVDEALNLRKEGERMMLEFSGGAAADTVAFADDPRSNALPNQKDLEIIKLPPEEPPVVENPFAIKGNWETSMTVPAMKQKVREPIVVGHRESNKWATIVISSHSIWSGAERGKVHQAAGNVIARKSRFESLELGADHASRYYFANCAFTNCTFPKVGWWHDGGWFWAKHYFENCYIKGSYADNLTIDYNGLRADTCVFEDVEFPTYRWGKHQPADFANDKWLKIVNSRFVKCKMPLSFLLLTRDCVFESCVVSDDINRGDDVEITKPLQIDMYVSNTQVRLNKRPPVVTINQKKYNEIKVRVPTAASLTELMAK
ncbi:MAG: hypothetical protein EOP88_07930 [Verrucomicrobiaceae bacterium]|nr:MAG: hypothetical protein EOP88_07930 [Verrucomicrobiaceae bacterium]